MVEVPTSANGEETVVAGQAPPETAEERSGETAPALLHDALQHSEERVLRSSVGQEQESPTFSKMATKRSPPRSWRPALCLKFRVQLSDIVQKGKDGKPVAPHVIGSNI